MEILKVNNYTVLLVEFICFKNNTWDTEEVQSGCSCMSSGKGHLIASSKWKLKVGHLIGKWEIISPTENSIYCPGGDVEVWNSLIHSVKKLILT